MRRDGPEGPELPHGRRQPENEEPGFLWPPTPGELALCILLFILFFAFSWGGPGPLGRGLHQHLGHRGGHGPRRPHRRGPDGGLLRRACGDGSL